MNIQEFRASLDSNRYSDCMVSSSPFPFMLQLGQYTKHPQQLIKSFLPSLSSVLPSFPSSLTAAVEKGTRFVEEGVKELLKARRVLCGSYVYGYYLEDNGYNKTIFEYMQVNVNRNK